VKIFIASPQDAYKEREAADTIIKRASGSGDLKCALESVRWEMNIPPGFRREHIQKVIDREAGAERCDIVLVILRQRIGTPVEPGEPSGTLHEFSLALRSWIAREQPWIMVYFDATPFHPKDRNELEQYDAVQSFKFSLLEQGKDCREYHGVEDFKKKFESHLPPAVQKVSEAVGLFSRDLYESLVYTADNFDSLLLTNDGHRIYSSYSPYDLEKPFRRVRLATTPGWVPTPPSVSGSTIPDHRKEHHHIYVLRDPIRPFEIQIGEYRAKRYGREPREVPFEGLPSRSELETLYPILRRGDQHRWLRMVLAELISDPRALEFMESAESLSKHEDLEIQKVIARNPSAPNWVRERECPFCNKEFSELREIPQDFSNEAVLIANDFPFGPFFHYIVFPTEPVHAWDAIEERHLYDMNWAVHQYLCSKYNEDRKTVRGAVGVRFGFNSSIRHLVLARRTRTSAGASVAHVHKQVWGMGEGSVNLTDHLRDICVACESRGQDYLGSYLEALEHAKMVIWSDENVALFVPFGQIALHELQIIVKTPRRTFLELTQQEVRSLSRAEYIVARLYGRMDINSFNEIMLSLRFAEDTVQKFRLIFTFITREVDLAVSELSLLYVVDRQPCDTVNEIARVWPFPRNLEDLV